MRTKKCSLLIAALAVVVSASLFGCSAGSGPNAVSTEGQSTAKAEAEVTFKALFPSSNESGAVKSLISANTKVIEIQVYPFDQTQQPTGTTQQPTGTTTPGTTTPGTTTPGTTTPGTTTPGTTTPGTTTPGTTTPGTTTPGTTTPGTTTPGTTTPGTTTPGTTTPSTASEGAALYTASCANCHQPLATSTKKGRSLTQTQAAITNNVGNMGPLSILTTNQLTAIVAALNPAPVAKKASLPIIKLTSAAPSQTIKLPPGAYMMSAVAFDSEDTATRKQIAFASTGGTIALGSNNVLITFLNGNWSFTDAAGAASPLVLSDGTVLNGFRLGTEQSPYSQGLLKSAIDFSKPLGGSSYSLRYLFSNNTSARTSAGQLAQFVGSSNSAVFMADTYNITKKCSGFTSYSGCKQTKGDQSIQIIGMANDKPDNGGRGILIGNARVLLPNKGEGQIVQNGVAIDLNAQFGTSIVDGVTITGKLLEVVLTEDTLYRIVTPTAKVAALQAIKAAQSSNTAYLNVKHTAAQPVLYASNGGTNKGTWQLFDKPKKTNDGKIYYYGGYLSNFDPATGQPVTINAGDYSFGLAPKDKTALGEYCHYYDFSQKKCVTKEPPTGDVYYPDRFFDLNGNGLIDYGSFAWQFYLEESQTGNVYLYPFIVKGK